MTDYWSVGLAGFATGIGVVLAQKFVNWLDRHPIIMSIKRRADDITRHRHR
jgi:hypothetical protein